MFRVFKNLNPPKFENVQNLYYFTSMTGRANLRAILRHTETF